MISSAEVKAFQEKIFTWYDKNKRDLPWRKTRDPYKILVSEIMSQQTQIGRVVPKYEAWLLAFPDVSALAKAKTSEVLQLWSGLGYNRRALFLQRCAQKLDELRIKNYELGEKDNYWPKTIGELKKLPGIGEYTAAAIACFAFDQQIAVVDTNVRKVILVHFCHPERSEGSQEILRFTQNDITTIAQQLLPKGQAYEWNQALMDYAAAVLKKEKIPIPKQSKFKGSNRYYRGQIIKMLIQKKEVTILQVCDLLERDAAFITMIVDGLVKDGMVVKKGEQLGISN